MSKVLRIILIVLGTLVVAGGLVFAGAWIGRRSFSVIGSPVGVGRRMGANGSGAYRNGPGMMGNGRGFGPGMMGSYNNSAVTPLTVDQAYQAATKYLATLNNSDLKIAEVMVFSNNAYVRVVEKSSGVGAFELLVDPVSLAVRAEPGPNMMWNLKYGGMTQAGRMGGRGGGMMGGYATSSTPAAVSASMPVSSAQALTAAQKYLDSAMPGAKTAAKADAFYGYYTIDILKSGKIVGMLSVNGFNNQVFLHTWHGTFIATKDY
jgi:hypothetical protein